MAKDKLRKFAEINNYSHVIQPKREKLLEDFELKGKWNKNFFEEDQPLVIELGCGKGEYTVGLAQKFPEKNFLGIDIKGARIWKGATTVQALEMKNAGFLRSQIELVDHAFGENEVDEIWITFPDPQIKFKRTKHRLTHPDFLAKYRMILKPGGTVHLKTDSEFLYGYTLGILQNENATIEIANHDIYHPDTKDLPSYLYEIQTHYENLFLKEGKKITYLKFRP